MNYCRTEEEKRAAAKALKEAEANSQDNSKSNCKRNGKSSSGKGMGKGKRKARVKKIMGCDEEALAKHSEASKAYGFEAMQFSF